MRKGTFVISLDFELYWGVRDHRTLTNYGSNIANVHSVVPQLLDLFHKNGIHCTWATVGFLFCNSRQDLEQYIPDHLPAYEDPSLDPYKYINEGSELESKYHFAPQLIKDIQSTPGQEIGTHTLSHFYTLEAGASTASFDSDMQQAVKLAGRENIRMKSIVFPRNQYSEEMLQVCANNGVHVYRGTEVSWIYATRSRAKETKLRRLFRLADSYFNLSGHHTQQPTVANGMINIPASRFLRPYNSKLAFLESLRLRRIKSSMKHAAQNGEMFHLWWHPHNFGSHGELNLAFLSKIIAYYKQLEQEYGMRSLNMGEIADLVK